MQPINVFAMRIPPLSLLWHMAGGMEAWGDREWLANYCGDNGLGSFAEAVTGGGGRPTRETRGRHKPRSHPRLGWRLETRSLAWFRGT